MLIQDKGKGTLKTYTAEMILLLTYYNNKTVDAIMGAETEQYIAATQSLLIATNIKSTPDKKTALPFLAFYKTF